MRNSYYKRKIRQANKTILLLAVIIAAIVTGIGTRWIEKNEEERKQQELADKVLRFHVLANSDQPKDQELKMQVRDAVLEYMKEKIPGGMDLEETIQWSRTHKNDIEMVGREEVERRGYNYPVNAAVTMCYFPEKKIYDQVFPAGNYTALRVEIGNAKGHNWWSLLYPNLCFLESVHVEEEYEKQDSLDHILIEKDEDGLKNKEEIEVKWYFKKLFQK